MFLTFLFLYNGFSLPTISIKKHNTASLLFCNIDNPTIISNIQDFPCELSQNEFIISNEILYKIHKNIIEYNLLQILINNNISNTIKLFLIENHNGKKTAESTNLFNGGLYNDWDFIL
jgi:hypothetical protein